MCDQAARATETWTDPEKRDRILESAERNVTRMTETLSRLVALSRSAHAAERAFVQQVEISTLTTDVIGQLREMADARGVEIPAPIARAQSLGGRAALYDQDDRPSTGAKGCAGQQLRRLSRLVSHHQDFAAIPVKAKPLGVLG